MFSQFLWQLISSVHFFSLKDGGIAQLVERRICIPKARSSTLLASIVLKLVWRKNSINAFDVDQSSLKHGANPVLNIIYEDRCLLVVHKPAGQLFQGHTSGWPQTLDTQVREYLRSQKPGSGNIYLGIIHRLDRPVSGVVVFGKNSKFTGRLSKQFQERKVAKDYLAITEGKIAEDHCQWIDELPSMMDEEFNAKENKITKRCELSFQVVERTENTTHVKISLGTGRRNQIRRQFSLHGHPIVGDKKFGATTAIKGYDEVEPLFRPIALHAAELRFSHPQTEQRMQFSAPLPWFWYEDI